MNVVDSSVWLEYLADGPNAGFFAPAVEENEAQIVPTLTIYEVFKRILQQRSENEALAAAALMQQGSRADSCTVRDRSTPAAGPGAAPGTFTPVSHT